MDFWGNRLNLDRLACNGRFVGHWHVVGALAAVVTTLQLGPSVLALFPAVADGRMDV